MKFVSIYPKDRCVAFFLGIFSLDAGNDRFRRALWARSGFCAIIPMSRFRRFRGGRHGFVNGRKHCGVVKVDGNFKADDPQQVIN